MSEPISPAIAGMPRRILRLEGAALLAAAVYAYGFTGASWRLFLVLFLAPDVTTGFAYTHLGRISGGLSAAAT